MSNLTVENVYTRHKAKELAKKHFWKLLGMMLIVGVIVYAITFGGTLLLNLPISATVTTSDISVMDAALAAANTPATSSNGVVFWLGYVLMLVVNILVSSGLSLGMTSAMLTLCRGESITVGRVFNRMNQCLKALGLSLWVGLKTLLWALPIYALALVAATALAFTTTGAPTNEGLVVLLTILPFLAVIAVCALVIPAALRYMLSTYILADKPATGIFACVNESKALMKGHKWQAFKLIIPIVLALYGLMIAFVLIFTLLIALLVEASAALTVIVAILFFVAFFGLAAFFSIRIGLAYCIFYLNRVKENTPEEAAPMEEAAEASSAE